MMMNNKRRSTRSSSTDEPLHGDTRPFSNRDSINVYAATQLKSDRHLNEALPSLTDRTVDIIGVVAMSHRANLAQPFRFRRRSNDAFASAV